MNKGVFVILAIALSADVFSGESPMTTENIIDEYDCMVREDFSAAKTFVAKNAQEGRQPMKSLYYLRPKNCTQFFFDNLHFDGRTPEDIIVMPAKSVEDQTVEGNKLCYLALLASGFSVNELYSAIVADKAPMRECFIQFSMLGRTCSGSFFDWHLENAIHQEENEKTKKRFSTYLSLSKGHFPPAWKTEKEYWQINQMVMPEEFKTEHGRKYGIFEQTLIEELHKALQDYDSLSILKVIHAMGHIRSLKAVPLLTENLTVCPQVSTNAPGGYVFPAAEALIEIGPAIGYCFGQLEKAAPLSLEESLWLRISHELYPEGLEYDLMRRAETNDLRAARLLNALQWRRLDADFNIMEEGHFPEQTQH